MKHYLTPIDEFVQAPNQVVVKAPFDGTITSIEGEGIGRGKQVWLTPSSNPNWKFIYFHINLLSNLKKGSDVKAGSLIGYANFDGEAANFDMALKRRGLLLPPAIESPFLYMIPEVLAEYAIRGITPENIIISKTEREANAL